MAGLDAMAAKRDALPPLTDTLRKCHEALLAFYETERKEHFSSLHARWREACRKITGDYSH